MVIKKKLLTAFLISSILCAALSAKSKKTNNTGFNSNEPVAEKEVDENSNESSVESELEEEKPEENWQYLEWEEAYPEYVLKYEVVIEKKENSDTDWIEINRLQTESNETRIQITPLLTPGLYRFKVITYDLIGIPEVESDWYEFNIYIAYVPQIRNISTATNHSSTIYLDEVNDGIINITGRNLFETQKTPEDISFTSYAFVSEKRKSSIPIVPDILEFSDNNRGMKIQLDVDSLDTGVYNYVATDASGLVSEMSKDSQLTVKFRKAVDFDISAGYACPILVIADRMKGYLNSSVIPLSATAKISLMPFKRKFGYLGMGVTASYSRLFSKTDGYTLDGNYITGHGLFVYQLPIRVMNKKANKLRHVATLELHGGAGVAMFNDTAFHFARDIRSEKLNSLDVSLIGGLSGQLYITNRLYVEAGADFIMPFMGKLLMGYIQPQIFVGWQF